MINFVKKIIPKKMLKKLIKVKIMIGKTNKNLNKFEKMIYFIKSYCNVKMEIGNNAEAKILNKCKIKLSNNNNFVLSIDEKYFNGNTIFGNTSLDYKKVLSISLNDLVNQYKNDKTEFGQNEYVFIKSIDNYLNRIIVEVKKSNIKNKEIIINNLESIKNKKQCNFHESLQKIIFYQTVAWQIGMNLNGLGRLDKILDEIYNNESDDLIYDFLDIINSKYEFKSGMLLGDTGQIIILGGLEKNGKYFSNILTYKFIEQLKKLNKPDPKILLRVSDKMDYKLLESAIDCIKTGIGSPLLSNDDVIIQKLIDFGYGDDAYDYITAACWEPLICGKSMDQNNINSINYMIPFIELLNNENLGNINDENLLNVYFGYLKKHIKNTVDSSNNYNFDKNPLLSLFTDDCCKAKKDISEGGAIYNNYGLTSVGLSSLVNSILNIKKLCFDTKLYTLEQLNNYRLSNFDDEAILKSLKNNNLKFGLDESNVIELTNNIISFVQNELSQYKTKFGGKFKFGLSSPDYITSASNLAATLDGRKYGEPFSTHISSAYPFDETIGFACNLNYNKNAFNGNVIDFMISPDYIENNLEKFTNYIYSVIKKGFFQMQMNVISSKQLIEAKENPNLYPNLIVRVWGFSSYFNDLPEEYKNILIERAIENERQ